MLIDQTSSVYAIDIFQKHVMIILERSILSELTSIRKLDEKDSRCAATVNNDLFKLFVCKAFEAVISLKTRIDRRVESDTDWRHCTLA